MDLSIITVTYCSQDYIDNCILSVVTHTLNCSYEHIIVDNASTDGTVALIEECYASYVRLIKNTRNLGFAAANNLAVKEAKGRYLLFLNPDMQILEGYLDALVAWMMARPGVGVAGCKLVSQTKEPHATLRPLKNLTLAPFLRIFLGGKTFAWAAACKFHYPDFDENKEQEVDLVRGAFFLMRRELVEKLGFAFDPRYFISYEDVDTCREAKKAGYSVVYTPCITCIDYVGRSFLKKRKAWVYRQVAKSFFTYVRKWHSPLHLLWLGVAIPLGFLLRMPSWARK